MFGPLCLTSPKYGEVRRIVEAILEEERDIEGKTLDVSTYSAFNQVSLQPHNAHVILEISHGKCV